jgi:hypothetical protein
MESRDLSPKISFTLRMADSLNIKQALVEPEMATP